MKYIIGVDLGGTSIKTGLVDLNGKIINKYEIETETKKGSKKIINNIIETIDKVEHGEV